MQSVKDKPFMLSVVMLNVVILSVIMLNVLAPFWQLIHLPSKTGEFLILPMYI